MVQNCRNMNVNKFFGDIYSQRRSNSHFVGATPLCIVKALLYIGRQLHGSTTTSPALHLTKLIITS